MRYNLCTLKNTNNEEKTAYLKEDYSKVGNIFHTDDDIWEVTSVSALSVTEDSLKKLNVDKKEFKK